MRPGGPGGVACGAAHDRNRAGGRRQALSAQPIRDALSDRVRDLEFSYGVLQSVLQHLLRRPPAYARGAHWVDLLGIANGAGRSPTARATGASWIGNRDR